MKNLTVHPRQKLYRANKIGLLIFLLSENIYKFLYFINEKKLDSEFSDAMKSYTGLDNILSLSSGRLALYLATKHSVSEDRNQVLMSPFTIFDMINMVRLGGGVPVFMDSGKRSPHTHIEEVRKNINEKTAAVLITHYHTSNKDMEEISELCQQRGIKIIEDCAINLGGKSNGHHVGYYSDFSIFSFGLYKFISAFVSGAIYVKSPVTRQKINAETAQWPMMDKKRLVEKLITCLKITVLTQNIIFKFFTFPLFRFGSKKNIRLITNNAKNDPNPFCRQKSDKTLFKKSNLFQKIEVINQIKHVENDRLTRVGNALLYYQHLSGSPLFVLPEKPEVSEDCFLNFPVKLKCDRKRFVGYMMESGFDLSIHYYRNCATIDCFVEYSKPLPNIESYVNNLVFFPTYRGISKDYITRLCSVARAFEL